MSGIVGTSGTNSRKIGDSVSPNLKYQNAGTTLFALGSAITSNSNLAIPAAQAPLSATAVAVTFNQTTTTDHGGITVRDTNGAIWAQLNSSTADGVLRKGERFCIIPLDATNNINVRGIGTMPVNISMSGYYEDIV
jgi:hypothetical protein